MPITFHPEHGTILYCNFDHQMVPEMVKTRPVVIISPKKHNSQLCTVVPLSGTKPDPIEIWHHKLDINKLPGSLQCNDWWAKCDCITTVRFSRLNRIKAGKHPINGKRIYSTPKLYKRDLEAIKLAIASHIGI